MLLVTHLVIALSSLLCTTYVFFVPSKGKLIASYALIASTLASGTALVISTHSPMLQSCTSGLFYLAVVSFGVVGARHRLAAAVARNKRDQTKQE